MCDMKNYFTNVSVLPLRRIIRLRVAAAFHFTDAVCEPFIALTREGYPVYYDYLLAIFAPVKQKPRVVEEHDSYSGVLSAVEAGTGVAIGVDVFDEHGLMRLSTLRLRSSDQRVGEKISLATCRRPDEHPGLSELGL